MHCTGSHCKLHENRGKENYDFTGAYPKLSQARDPCETGDVLFSTHFGSCMPALSGLHANLLRFQRLIDFCVVAGGKDERILKGEGEKQVHCKACDTFHPHMRALPAYLTLHSNPNYEQGEVCDGPDARVRGHRKLR